MKRIAKMKYRHCRRIFVPDPPNRDRQKYCSRSPSRKASKAASQKKWLSKPENKDHFKGPSGTKTKSQGPEDIHAFFESVRQMEQRRMNPFHHIRQIVALAEIYAPEEVTRAIEDAFHFKAFSCDYNANLLERRSRKVKEPGALHLTRSSDLLDLTINKPDLSIYDMGGEK